MHNIKVLFSGMLFLLLFVAIALTYRSPVDMRVDHWIYLYIQDVQSDIITGIMKTFTTIGSGLVVSILTAIAAMIIGIRWRNRFEAVVFATTVAGSYVLNMAAKAMFHRARPDLHRLITETGFSFPSGHAMEAFTFYGMLAYLLWRRIHKPSFRCILVIVTALMILGIGISRIYLGVHYPSDVAGGYLLSGAWLSLAMLTSRTIRRSRKI